MLEKSKFNMTWYINILLVPLWMFLVSIHLIYNDPNIATSSLGLLLAISSLIIQHKLKDYKPIAVASVILGTILCQVSVYVIADSQIISDLMWIILVSFYAFYLIGSRWGIVVMLGNIFGLLLHLGYFIDYNSMYPDSDQAINLKTGINVSIVTIVISFIIHKIISSSEQANKELQRANEQLSHQNEEKTILIKEIHHRVKNNLQLISSLLRLQSQEINDTTAEKHFNEAVDRIKSIALIHEKMYQQDEFAKIDLKEYLNSLVSDILFSHNLNKSISTNINSDLSQINIKNIVPLALLLNELITNSLKHAFKGINEGNISINITQENDNVHISYSDNGHWTSPQDKSSFGLELIETLCQQLDGEMKRDTKIGTSYNIICKLDC